MLIKGAETQFTSHQVRRTTQKDRVRQHSSRKCESPSGITSRGNLSVRLITDNRAKEETILLVYFLLRFSTGSNSRLEPT